MKVTIFTRTENLSQSQFFKTYLEHYGNTVKIFDNPTAFYRELRSSGSSADFLLADYSAFNHLVINVYKYFTATLNCTIPLIFFNDPAFDDSSQIDYWISLLSMVYSSFPGFDPEKLKTFLYFIDNALHYFKSPSSEKNLTSSIQTGFQNKASIPAYKSDVASRLNASAFKIYDLLSSSISQNVRIENLLEAIRKNEKDPKLTTVRCAISKIRNVLKDLNYSNIKILKTATGYKMINK